MLSGILRTRRVCTTGLLCSRFLSFMVGYAGLMHCQAALVRNVRLGALLLRGLSTLGSVLAQLAGLWKVTLHGRAAVVGVATRLGAVRPQAARVLLLSLSVRLVPLPVVARSVRGSRCHHGEVWCPLVLPVERTLLADLNRHTRLVMSLMHLLLAGHMLHLIWKIWLHLLIAEVLEDLSFAIWRVLAQMGLNLNLAQLQTVVLIEISLLVAEGLPDHCIWWNMPDAWMCRLILLRRSSLLKKCKVLLCLHVLRLVHLDSKL